MAESGGKAQFVSENYGGSELAKRFGVTRYPAIFVDDILVATPNDFGFYGKGEEEKGGRYSPLQSATSHERFRFDLKSMIDLIVAGKRDAARAQAAPSKPGEIAAFPDVTLTDIDGKTLTRADLLGRAVLVDFWATWCPPCRGTLPWLGDLQKKFGDRLAIVTIAVESKDDAVRKVAGDLKLPVMWVQGSPELVRSFGDVSAVPTLLVFDRQSKTAAAFYGAPPTLHAAVEAELKSLLE